MKNKILIGIVCLAIAAVVAFNVNIKAKGEMSMLTLANLEALATESNEGYKGTRSECESTKTIETYTAGPGWTYEIKTGGGVKWFLNGVATASFPSDYTKTTEVIKSSWEGCKPQGETTCHAPSC